MKYENVLICLWTDFQNSSCVFYALIFLSKTGSRGEDVLESLYRNGLRSPQAFKCGELLNMMLTKGWPPSRNGVQPSSLEIFRHVLTGRLWPCFFKRFGEFL